MSKVEKSDGSERKRLTTNISQDAYERLEFAVCILKVRHGMKRAGIGHVISLLADKWLPDLETIKKHQKYDDKLNRILGIDGEKDVE